MVYIIYNISLKIQNIHFFIFICWLWLDTEIQSNYNDHFRKNKSANLTNTEVNKKIIHLLIPLNGFSFDMLSIAGNEIWKGTKYFFITKWGWSRNGVIHLYQDILRSLNQDPTKDITKDTRNEFIRLKYSK